MGVTPDEALEPAGVNSYTVWMATVRFTQQSENGEGYLITVSIGSIICGLAPS